MKPIAIFNNGPIRRMQPGFYQACGGDLDRLFASASGLPLADFIHIDAEGGEALPDAGLIAGVILTGSASMVTDRHAWAEAEADWVRRNRNKVPMLGVCFGHQLLTHALGGTVDWTPSGPEYGTIEVTLTDAAADDPLFAGLPASLNVQSAHSQAAMELPPGAQLLAANATGIQAARFDQQIWGLQFHPEFEANAMLGLFEAYRDTYTERGFDVDGLIGRLKDTSHAARFIQTFVRSCLATASLRASSPGLDSAPAPHLTGASGGPGD